MTLTWLQCETYNQNHLLRCRCANSHFLHFTGLSKPHNTTVAALKSAGEDAFSHVAAFQFLHEGSVEGGVNHAVSSQMPL